MKLNKGLVKSILSDLILFYIEMNDGGDSYTTHDEETLRRVERYIAKKL